MGKCTLAIEPRSPGRIFVQGDTIDVIVHVDASAAIKCKALTVELAWRTHGKGNTAGKSAWSQRLFSGELTEGRESYPCSIPIPRITPATPATYHGHYINIDWYVCVRADIPWALDPKDELRVDLAPANVRPSDAGSFTWKVAPVVLKGKLGPYLFLAVLLIGGAIYASSHNPWIAVALIAPVAFVVQRYIRELGARKRVGVVELGHFPDPAVLGEPLHGLVRITPPKDFRTQSVALTVRATERATSGSGTNQTTYKHVVFERSQQTGIDALVFGGEPFSADLVFDLPADLAPTFEATDNTILWSLELAVLPRAEKPLACTVDLRVVGA